MALIEMLREKEYGRFNGESRRDCRWKCSLLENLHSNNNLEFEIQAQTEGSSVPPMACEYSPYLSQSDLVAVADEDGGVNIYDSDAGGMRHVESWSAHENAVFDLAWHPERREMLTASGDLSLRLWDVSTSRCVRQYCGHEASVKCVSYNPLSTDLFASGSRDGDIMLWDTRLPGRVAVISKSHQNRAASKKRPKTIKGVVPSMSITDCIFRNDYHLITCGATNGTIKVWDLRKNYSLFGDDPKPAQHFPYAGQSTATHGYTCMALDPYGTYLYANCTDRCIYRFNVLTYPSDATCTYYGHRVDGSFYIKLALSPDGEFLLGGSTDKCAYVWKVRDPGYPTFRLEGHGTEVTSLSWNKFDLTKVATCGDDNKVVFWQCGGRRALPPPYVCSPFVSSEGIPKPQWTPKQEKRETKRVVGTPRSVADWLTPPSKRLLLATPKSHHGKGILSPRKVDNGCNLPQRRLLPTLDFVDGENSVSVLETPPRNCATSAGLPSTKKKHKAKMRLFRRNSSRGKSQARRKLDELQTITSFFKS